MFPSLRRLPRAQLSPPSFPGRIDSAKGAPEASPPPRGTILLCPPPGLFTSIPSRKRNRGFLLMLAVLWWGVEVDPGVLVEGVEGLHATQGMTDIVTPSSVSPALDKHTREGGQTHEVSHIG